MPRPNTSARPCRRPSPLRRPAALALALGLALAGPPALAADVLVAVAANFAEVLEQLRPDFERSSGHRIVASSAGTGALLAQIRNGAPFQVLLAADTATPERLVAAGAAVGATRFTYAVGKLVLWSADPAAVGADGLATLRAGRFRHLAIANPDLAPYGVAARQVLQGSGTWAALHDRLVLGQNIGQTHTLVASGAAELGFVALSSLRGGRTPGGSRWVVPQALYAPLQQDAVLLAAGRDSSAARALLDHLKTAPARRLIAAFGYGVE